MTSDSDAMAIGLGAGLGGFIGFLIIVWLLWQCFCGSWCEKKQKSSIIIPMTKQSSQKTYAITAISSDMKNTVSNPDYSR